MSIPASQNTIPAISIKLSKENYDTWAPIAKQALTAYDLGMAIEGAIPPPKNLSSNKEGSTSINPDYINWMKKDSLAKRNHDRECTPSSGQIGDLSSSVGQT
ncbi:hypothetical protein RND81_11G098700 [Saponaria officinalis]|uniref:Retrotransposon Copia-like N-terminal domain-containing protein n=1 Tax=Saponaria officinalis TaxID=3572 RepID=A0AAW1HK47_SAPOF